MSKKNFTKKDAMTVGKSLFIIMNAMMEGKTDGIVVSDIKHVDSGTNFEITVRKLDK